MPAHELRGRGRAWRVAAIAEATKTGGRVERTPPVCRSALYSPFLPPFGPGSVTVFDPAPLCASPSQKPACGFPAQASSDGLSPDGIHGDDGTRSREGMPCSIAAKALPREAAPLTPA